MNRFRVIPSIEQLRQRDAVRSLEAEYGHDAVVRALRDETDLVRARLAQPSTDASTDEVLAGQIEDCLARRLRVMLSPSLRPVINATGVIVHTNLGRAPLARQAVAQIAAVAGYSNLEFDLDTGVRGSRTLHAASLLKHLTGAEDATVVNNNAAAVLLTLTALAAGREVIISRGSSWRSGAGSASPMCCDNPEPRSGRLERRIGRTPLTMPPRSVTAPHSFCACTHQTFSSRVRRTTFPRRYHRARAALQFAGGRGPR